MAGGKINIQPPTQACVPRVVFVQKVLPSHLAASLVKSQGERKEDAVPWEIFGYGFGLAGAHPS